MTGYLGDARATAETLDADGFLHTGDVATVSAEGYVPIVDRVKELIKYKGYQVPPAELEALLLTHPGIADCRGDRGARRRTARRCRRRSWCGRPASAVSADDVMTSSSPTGSRRTRRCARSRSSRPSRSRPPGRSCARTCGRTR